MSDQYEEDKPWHLTQEPDEVPCYEDLETRIEELEAENHLLKTSGIAEVAVKNSSVMEYMQHWEGRAEAAEAKLAKAVRFIKLSVELGRWDLNPSFRDEMIDFAAELRGSKP